MYAATAETAAGVRGPRPSGTDGFFFKVLFFALVTACSLTTYPLLYLGGTGQSSNLMYGDAPLAAFLAFVVILARLLDSRRVRTGGVWVFLPMFSLLAWWGISGISAAKNPGFFAVSWGQFAIGALVVLLSPWALIRYGLVGFAMDAILANSVLVSLAGLVQGAVKPSLFFEAITSTLSLNHVHIGLYMMVSLAVALHRVTSRAGRPLLPAVAATLAFVTILISGSRAAQVGSFVILMAHFSQRLSFANFLKFAVGSLLAGGVLLYIVKQRQHATVGAGNFEVAKGIEVDRSAGRRVLMWIVSWKVINSSPDRFVRGIGFTNYRWEYGKLIKLPFYTNAAHNAYLHIWTETGLVGLALYLWMLIALIWFGWKHRKSDPPALLLGALSAGMLVTALTQETLYPNESMGNFNVYFFFACLLFVLHAREREVLRPRKGGPGIPQGGPGGQPAADGAP